MMLTTKALIIKEQTVGESDKLVTLLTEKEGVIRAFARRAKSLKDSKSSATSLLSYSNFSIYKGKEKYIIDSATPIEVFFELRNDIISLSLAQYFCDLSANLVSSESSQSLKVVLNSIYFLCKMKKDPLLLKAISELKLLSLNGYMPNLVACKNCVCYDNDFWLFLPETGEIICQKCYNNERNAFSMNSTVLTAMRYILYKPVKEMYSFTIPEKDIETLCFISENYMTTILGKTPQTLDFFKTINDRIYY